MEQARVAVCLPVCHARSANQPGLNLNRTRIGADRPAVMTPRSKPITANRAAIYVRMSTELQQYSVDFQTKNCTETEAYRFSHTFPSPELPATLA